MLIDNDPRNVETRNVEIRNVEIRNVATRNVEIRNVEIRNVEIRNVEIRSPICYKGDFRVKLCRLVLIESSALRRLSRGGLAPFRVSESTAWSSTTQSLLRRKEERMGAEGEASSVLDMSNGQDEEELQRLQRECSAMVKLLKNLEKEEHDLQCQLEVLAREAIMCGFDPNVVEPALGKRRRGVGANKKEMHQ